MKPPLFLLYPEWQGSGKSPAVQEGARTIARELFPDAPFLMVNAPDIEPLRREDGVIGLASIAPRFRDALARLRAAAPERVVTIGGTCGVEAAPIAYLNDRLAGQLAVVWFDAHGDLNTPASSPSGHFHGMILRTLLGDGPEAYVREIARPLRPQQIFLVGTRDLDPPEAAFVAESRISVTPPEDVVEAVRLVDEISRRGFSHLYIHLDLDALDPSEFPDTLIPTPGGPPLDDVRRLLKALARSFDVAGASVVEYVRGEKRSLRTLSELVTCYFPG